MKKRILIVLSLIFLLLAIIFFLNPRSIYKLSDKTAQFIPQQAIPEELISLKARDCGVCHSEIYQEWQTSLHSKAFTDPFFTAYLKKDKGDPTCLVCHTPLLNQSPVILSSDSGNYHDLKITDNPGFDPDLQQEGVTCVSCHLKDGIIYGPYKKNTLNSPHPVAYDEKFLKKSQCQQCHEVPSKDFSLMNEGVCSTGMESNSGLWSAKGFVCQDCHMPSVTRPLMKGYPAREGRKHLWPGAYSSQQLQKIFTFKANRSEDTLTITITNSGAGHKAPTGDPDRFIVLDFFWEDENGQHIPLESIEFKRQIVWQPIMFVLSDNRLASGESIQLSIDRPSVSGNLYVNGTYHVMTDRSLKRLKDKFELKNEWDIHRPFIKKQKIDIH
ncbi:MAG: cytochrome c family protein [gamma proteobacterium symbiont of Bathyaustriella thionipta]|nr:cytochrome c family protein [gamma proteobacterium symbiont of Bathyaustriella thionipta]MCU7950797.1 cytochrome c family protein [gamma proteobacterium symbiont of Bathyaustriella thionipta]MCU7952152.1 cytochrome c family protein [gamma proteobacterium symbiont of Bathyaustriella thionipta]MCU7957309.1 cytochrome c family protein [gamma proteobacterium symbiont of Bathyaustriella thionipta]MCU7966540.1 cytochrome c family protein [gamma proteobacterium symbiont of Bathyaustriella thionipta